MKRFFGVLTLSCLAMTLVALTGAPEARANENCIPNSALVSSNGEIYSPAEFLAGSGSTRQELIDVFASDLADSDSPSTPDTLALRQELLNWLAQDCADPVASPEEISNHPAGATGPYGWGTLNPVAAPSPVAAAAVATAEAPLAHTGVESSAMAYLGFGLVGFGAVALGSRRRLK